MANSVKRVATSATTALIHLWEESFFRTRRKKVAIDVHLAKRGNHFSAPELGMALMGARFLARKGGQGHYEYIQRHPFVPPEKAASARKKA
jgi:hypothetical protein